MKQHSKEEIIHFINGIDQKEYDQSPLLWHAYQKLKELLKQYDDVDKIIYEWQQTHEYQCIDSMSETGNFNENEIYVPYVSISDGVEILMRLGVKYSSQQLNDRLLELGKIAGIEGILPVSEFLSFLNGTLITNPILSNNLIRTRRKLFQNIQQIEGEYIKVDKEPDILDPQLIFTP